jgi:predicted nucleic acid-binding protein
MSVDKTFVDTHVLVYAHNADASSKHERAKLRIADLWSQGAGVVSLQVLEELYVNLTRKVSVPLAKATAREVVRAYARWLGDAPDAALIIRAAEIEELHHLSFRDALIVASANKAGARVLLSEDLHDGQVIEGVRVENPFRPL